MNFFGNDFFRAPEVVESQAQGAPPKLERQQSGTVRWSLQVAAIAATLSLSVSGVALRAHGRSPLHGGWHGVPVPEARSVRAPMLERRNTERARVRIPVTSITGDGPTRWVPFAVPLATRAAVPEAQRGWGTQSPKGRRS